MVGLRGMLATSSNWKGPLIAPPNAIAAVRATRAKTHARGRLSGPSARGTWIAAELDADASRVVAFDCRRLGRRLLVRAMYVRVERSVVDDAKCEERLACVD